MAKIPRKTQQIFAENAGSQMITAFGTAMTDSPIYTTDLTQIQNANFQAGWESAIQADKAPYEEDTNGLLYAFTTQLAYIFQQGLTIEYDPNTVYFKGSIVAVINEGNVNFYISLSDNNIGNDVTDEINWQLHSISKIDEYYNNLISQLANCVKLTGNQSVAGNKTFTGTVKVPNSATVGTPITTSAISKSNNGYLKMGNGIILQWGRTSMKHETVKTITFPTPFTSTNYSVCLTGERYTSGDVGKTDDLCFTYNAISKTAVGIYPYDAGGNSYTTYVRWLAIGY